ncbi:MAG: hypothetical protein HLX51_01360 [Micrococcaceae bacterium]|nr:hypothetical protein [Micrococcaceae bacterium]
MKTPRKTAIKALAVSPLLALALTSCSSEPQDPSAIMSEYVEHLNSGDFEAALELVHDPGDITADSLIKIEGIDIAEPATSVEEFSAEDGTQDVEFKAEGDSEQVGGVTFVSTDDGWLIEQPLFLTQHPDGIVNDLLDEGAEIFTADGAQIDHSSRVVTHSAQDANLSIDFPGNDFAEAQQFEALTTFTPGEAPVIPIVESHEGQQAVVFEIADKLYQELQALYTEIGPISTGNASFTVLDFPDKEECSIMRSATWELGVPDPDLLIQCGDPEEGITVGKIEKEYLGAVTQPVEGSLTQETIHSRGDIVTLPSIFIAEVADGEIKSAGFHSDYVD